LGGFATKKKRIAKEILSWIKTLAIALVIAFIVNHTLVASALVISSSMENTIMTDSRVMGLRVAYILHEPERFDIILFQPPDDETSYPYVKRIIGLPNEKVEIIDGKVYINDSDVPLDDHFIMEDARGSFGPYFVPEGSYFVLGDNRNISNDSRYWVNNLVPFVPRDSIQGRIYFEFFPTPHFLD
jgi:signal peptidase I